MKKMRMYFPREKTFEDGFKEYVLDCKARNLREGTINRYQESIKQIYKRIPPDTPISSMNKQTMADFYIALREADGQRCNTFRGLPWSSLRGDFLLV